MKPWLSKNSHLRRATSNRRGTMLVLTVTVMFLIAMAMLSVLLVTANALHLTYTQQIRAVDFNTAESGAEAGYQWLVAQSTPPTTLTAFDPYNGAAQSLDGVPYTVVITPDPGNTTNYLKVYTITATATYLGVSKTVELVVRQASFGRYAYFTDKEVSSISGGTISWKAGEQVDGPVHSNNSGGSNFYINYNGSNAPIFLDSVTAAGTSINYTPSRPTNETTFQKIFQNGSRGYTLGVPPIQLPTSTDIQKNAAWGSTSGFPSTNGVYLKASSNGGIFVKGDCTILLSLDGSGNQKVAITVGSSTTTLTMNRSTKTTSVSGTVGTGSDTSGVGLPNGAIYCTGNITSLQGTVADSLYSGGAVTVRSAMTIATDVANNKDITVTDDILYNTQPDKTQSDTANCNLAAGTLGLVSHNTIVSTTTGSDATIDAVMMCGGQNTTDGSFYAQSYDTRSVGTLKVLGGIIQKARGPVGTFNPSTGQTSTGFTKNYHYDPRLAVNPPPFYPTTGQYERLSWKVKAN